MHVKKLSRNSISYTAVIREIDGRYENNKLGIGIEKVFFTYERRSLKWEIQRTNS